MYASAAWINAYLDPPSSPPEQADLLTRAGFPLEGRLDVEGDVRQDFELTSNRGDCLCHLGLAREIAAMSGRTLRPPTFTLKAGGPPASKQIQVTNRHHAACPLYTARVIRGARVKPSPAWLAARLRAIGQIPRNNIVDASNFVLFEMGQPTHVFDLQKLAGPEIVIRPALDGEAFLPIGEGATSVALSTKDLVIADRDKAVAIAGVKGGAGTAVTATTTDLLLEAATFDPVAVRETSRRLGIESDSAYRFERGVHPATVDAAAARLAALILEVAGGVLADGVVAAGAPLPPRREVSMRVQRCCDLLGVPVEPAQMVRWLESLGFEPRLAGGEIRCRVPFPRLDIDREIDLIEEVGRMMGHDTLPVAETIQVRVPALQPAELARRAVSAELVGMGFVESITHSLIGEPAAAAFLEPEAEAVRILGTAEQREGTLRPSILPSLLRTRAHNRDNGVGRLRLFESAATWQMRGDVTEERAQVALLMDVDAIDNGLRPLRGVVDRLVTLLCGPDARTRVEPDDSASWLEPGAVVSVEGRALGRIGVVAPAARAMFGLEALLLAGELALPALYDSFPPDTEARPLPGFPVVERDVSAIVAESTPWAAIEAVIEKVAPADLEAVEYVSSYRGAQVGAGRKSVLLRLRFRGRRRTLTGEEVDAQVSAVTKAMEAGLRALIRR